MSADAGCDGCAALVRAGRSVLDCAEPHHEPQWRARVRRLEAREAAAARLLVLGTIACVYAAAVATAGLVLGSWIGLLGWGLT